MKSFAKTIIVIGETGTGKSTFLNAIVNYLEAIQINDYFRYKIICETVTSQTHSVTQEISIYYVKDVRNGDVYRIIDTPGFGDTSGIDKDGEHVKKIENLFRTKIDEIHCVLFVMKASTNRVTAFQHYVFQSVMDIFGKDIAKNFVFVFTFSDSGKPLVLDSVKEKSKGFGNYWDSISEPKYLSVNNCGIFQKVDLKDKINLEYWNIGMLCMEKLFSKLKKLKGCSLRMTKSMINKK